MKATGSQIKAGRPAWQRLVLLLLIAASGLTALTLIDIYYRGQIRQANSEALLKSLGDAQSELNKNITATITSTDDLQAFMLASPSLPDYETFDRFAALMLDHYPQVLAIQYVDPDMIIRHTYPLAGNEATLNLDLTTRPAAPFVEKAIQEKRMTVNDPSVTVQGSLSVVPRAPLYQGNKLLGLVQVVVEIDPLLKQTTENLDERFQLQLQDATGTIFWGPDILKHETESTKIQVGDNFWTLSVGWRIAPPAPEPFALRLIWASGGLLLMSVLALTNQTWSRTEWLRRTVAERTETLEAEIAQRRETEEALRDSQEKFRQISENIHEVFWMTDHQKNQMLYISLAYEDVWGRTCDSLYASPKSWLEAIHEEDRARVVEAARTKQALGEYDEEYRILRPDGTLRWIHDRAFPIRDETGAVYRITGIAEDTTERKQAEEQLHFQAKLLNVVGQAVIVTDPAGTVTWINRAAENLYGWSAEEVIGRGILDVTVPQMSHEQAEDIIAQLSKGKSWSGEFLVQHRDGTIFPAQVDNSTIRDEEGKVIGIIGISSDITERKRAEEKIKELNRQLLKAQEIAGLGFLDWNLLTNEIYLSPQAHRIFGITEDLTHVSEFIQKAVHPDDLNFVNENLNLAIQGVKTYNIDHRIIRSNGEVVWLKNQAELTRDENGAPINLLGTVLDITERKQAEAALQEAHDLLERRVEERTIELTLANKTKDDFLANMSHELRTPLNSILGFTEILLEQERGPLNEKQEQYINLVNSSGQHLLGLINDILEVSKVEAGKLKLHPVIVSVNDVCESSLNFIKEMAVKKSISIEFTNMQSISTLRADHQRLIQILVNLLSNAVKFTHDQGKVLLEVQTDSEKDQIQFSVQDNGIGIAHEDLSKLFVPFTQLDSSLSRQYEGTGLGLMLVLKLTELHGGSVQVESEPNQGSRFTVTLPWRGDEKNLEKEMPAADIESADMLLSSSGAGSVILLAEDIESNILAVNEYLAGRGFQVVIARNGLEAIQRAEELHPNIILMDIQMPQMNGLEAIRRLRAKPEFVSVPIIALTALAMPGDRERCLEAGANEYMSKPVSLKMLVKTIQELVTQLTQ